MNELTFNEWQLHIRRLLNYPEDRLKIYEDNLKPDGKKSRGTAIIIRTKKRTTSAKPNTHQAH